MTIGTATVARTKVRRTLGVSASRSPRRRLSRVRVGNTATQIISASWCLVGGGSGLVRWTAWTLDMGELLSVDGRALVWFGLDGGGAGQAGGPPRCSATAAAVSSSASWLLIAIAAADPSPAAVTT